MSFPPAIPAAPVDDREEDYVSARASHWAVFTGLLPFVWPKDRPDLRTRVVLAFGVLVLAKLVTVAVPIFYKDATDRLTALAGAEILLAPHQTGGCKSGSPCAMQPIDVRLWHERETSPEALRAEFQGDKGRGWLMRWLPSRAHDNGMFLVFANGVGQDDDEAAEEREAV